MGDGKQAQMRSIAADRTGACREGRHRSWQPTERKATKRKSTTFLTHTFLVPAQAALKTSTVSGIAFECAWPARAINGTTQVDSG
eukprot:2199200-Rhodomonas_salina.1